MKNERTYCKSCCSPQRTIRDRAGLRCSACERLLVPLQHHRHRPVKNASHSRVKEFAVALRESLDRQPLAAGFDPGRHQELTMAYHHEPTPENYELLKASHIAQAKAASDLRASKNDLRHPLKIQQRDELLARRDYLLTPNGGRFQIEQGSIADRFIWEQEAA